MEGVQWTQVTNINKLFSLGMPYNFDCRSQQLDKSEYFGGNSCRPIAGILAKFGSESVFYQYVTLRRLLSFAPRHSRYCLYLYEHRKIPFEQGGHCKRQDSLYQILQFLSRT